MDTFHSSKLSPCRLSIQYGEHRVSDDLVQGKSLGFLRLDTNPLRSAAICRVDLLTLDWVTYRVGVFLEEEMFSEVMYSGPRLKALVLKYDHLLPLPRLLCMTARRSRVSFSFFCKWKKKKLLSSAQRRLRLFNICSRCQIVECLSSTLQSCCTRNSRFHH